MNLQEVMVDVAFTLPDLFVYEEVEIDELANKSGNVCRQGRNRRGDRRRSLLVRYCLIRGFTLRVSCLLLCLYECVIFNVHTCIYI